MIDVANLGWPSLVLSVLLIADTVMIARPPAFIAECLEGVGFPRSWWWSLIVVKLLAAAGLIAGLWLLGVGLAAGIGVLAYCGCAIAAHLRARSLGSAFWVNCLGFTAVTLAVLLVDYAAW